MLKAGLIRVIYTGIMFLAALVLSNLALPERFGTISLLILNASLLGLVTGLGSEAMILYKVSNAQWTIGQAFHFAWRNIAIQLAIFLAVEALGLMLFGSTALSAKDSSYFVVDLLYFSGLVIVEKYMALYYCLHRTKIINLILAVIAFLYFSALLIFYYFIKIDFRSVLYIFAFQSLVQGVALIIHFGWRHSGDGALDRRQFLNAVRLSSVVMFTNVVQLLAYRIDFWMLKYFYGNYEVGLYAQANKFANLSWIVPNIMAQMLLPKFATMDKRQVGEIFGVSFISNFFVLGITIICTQLFFMFYLSPEYAPALHPFYLMLPGYFFWATVAYFGAFVSSSGRFNYNLAGSSLCLVLITAADFLLIPHYGINGAAVANAIVYSAVFIFYLVLLRRKYSFSFPELLLPRKEAFLRVLKILVR